MVLDTPCDSNQVTHCGGQMAEGIIGHCVVCAAQFAHKKGKSNRFCCMACYRAHQRAGGYKRGHGPDFPKAPCAHCGAQVERIPSECRDGSKSDKVFCNRDCYHAFRTNMRLQRNRQCAQCGKDFIAEASTSKYCSDKCWKAGKKASPKHCLNCGCWFTPMKFHAQAGRLISANSGKTCSATCAKAWISNNEERKRKIGDAFRSVNHPNWQGGKSHINNLSNRGPNWKRQRAAALRRDGYRCVDCGLTEDECLAKFGRSLDVDHECPYHNFSDYRKANALSNLASRCASCHKIAESKRSMVQMVLPMQDNVNRRHKGGQARGEKINTAKLTAVDVLLIRRRSQAGEALATISADFESVLKSTIRNIINRKTWRHI